MAVLEPVNVMEMDRATSQLAEVHENPTRVFLHVPLAPDGIHWAGTPAQYIWQNGHWFDTGGNEMDEQEVPQKFRDEIAANRPAGRIQRGPSVTWACDYCGQTMNASESNAHLQQHMKDLIASAGPVPKPLESERPITAKNTHAKGA